MKFTHGLAAILITFAPALASAQGIGSKLPEIELEGFANTPAKSFDDFMGRAVLIEFFAFW